MARKYLTPIDLTKLELQNARIQNLATAPASPAIGQIYFDTVLGYLRVWTGTAWENTSQGAQGTQGTQGTTGAQGTQGTQGTAGAQGLDGANGTQGTQGTQGTLGTQGTQGTLGAQGVQGADGIQGLDGANGAQGTQGTEGAQGTEGQQGVQGTQGTQGVQGTEGTQGTQGTEGAQGTQGTEGAQGTQGTEGAQGTEGTQGVQGTQGTQGVQGEQGTQGVQGTEGTQGATGTFGGETHEYNYLTNVTESDPGSGNVKFDTTTFSAVTELYIDDIDFNSVDISQFLETIDDSTSGIKGTIKVTKVGAPTNYAFFQIIGSHTDNGTWYTVPVAYVSGTLTVSNDDNVYMTFARVGDKGDTGLQGTQGVQGTTGAQGVQGTQGTQGVQGTEGQQGVQGTEGAQGTQGTEGAQGTQGTEGAQGTEGQQGVQGTQGTQGVQGTLGTQGAQGTEGAQGAEGQQGIQGTQGTEGAQGTQGTQGTDGIQGLDGAQGTQGTVGAQGTQGTQGTDGTQGAEGAQGSQGTVGAQGAQGTTGTQGVQGSTGTQGTAGSDASVTDGYGIQVVGGQVSVDTTEIATRDYVDATAQGLDVKQSVRTASSAALAAYTFTNTGGGTLTADANGTLTVGSVTLAQGQRVLIKDEAGANQKYNGIYSVATAGDGSTPWELMRADDANASADVTAGMFTFVEEGTYADTGWVLTTNNTITLNTTALTFTQFSGAGAYTWGAGLSNTGTTIDVGAGTGITVDSSNVNIDTTVVARKYTTTVGDGAATAFTITHNLGTRGVMVSVYNAASAYEEVVVDVEKTTTNTVTVRFAEAPANNAYVVAVVG